MIHYFLLKFEPDYYGRDVLNYTKEVFNSIVNTIDDVLSAEVYGNCIERDSNMDIMVVMRFGSKEALSSYLNHQLHLEFVNTIDKHVVSRVSFDCNDMTCNP